MKIDKLVVPIHISTIRVLVLPHPSYTFELLPLLLGECAVVSPCSFNFYFPDNQQMWVLLIWFLAFILFCEVFYSNFFYWIVSFLRYSLDSLDTCLLDFVVIPIYFLTLQLACILWSEVEFKCIVFYIAYMFCVLSAVYFQSLFF